jgi:hypothetical protein
MGGRFTLTRQEAEELAAEFNSVKNDDEGS